MLRRYGVSGGVGKIIEYYGAGLSRLTAMDRHVIANMGAELGATTSVFPSDEMTRAFLESQGRGQDWRELKADPAAAMTSTITSIFRNSNLLSPSRQVLARSSPSEKSRARKSHSLTSAPPPIRDGGTSPSSRKSSAVERSRPASPST